MAGGFDPGTEPDTVQQARPLHHAPAVSAAKPAPANETLATTSGTIVTALISAGLGYAAYRRVDQRR